MAAPTGDLFAHAVAADSDPAPAVDHAEEESGVALRHALFAAAVREGNFWPHRAASFITGFDTPAERRAALACVPADVAQTVTIIVEHHFRARKALRELGVFKERGR